MKRRSNTPAFAALLLVSAGIGAQSTTEPLSSLPLPPGFKRTGDAVQSFKYCGKSASVALYMLAVATHESGIGHCVIEKTRSQM
jgi:hypothetical protein